MNRFPFMLLAFSVFACDQPSTETTSPVESPKVVLSDSSTIAHPVGYQFPEEETFKVLSWNVEHFVDPYDDPYIRNRREDNPDPDMPQRAQLLVEAIKMADADVVILQEFESEKYLMSLARDSFPELGYQFFADAASPGWYMNVVLMSRFPLGVLQAYGDIYTPVTGYVDDEGNKQTQVNLNTRMWTMQIFADPSYDFWLTGVHLKAGRGPRNEAMRAGQIHLLNQQFDQLVQQNPEANLMMAGDFNAYPNSNELKLLTDNHLIDPMDSTVWTHPSDLPARRLDYMLVNQGMANEMVVGSVQPVYFFNADSMRMLSDHLPVIGEFRRGEKP
ncbi:MAG: endonuclease/exonuclease/phosphatase family protein [Cytophagales bacterium]|nr:endonuclease/exonuclease/phosphatase family protein [Cytophagales bacterium]